MARLLWLRSALELGLPLLLCLLVILFTSGPNLLAGVYLYQAITHQPVWLGYNLP